MNIDRIVKLIRDVPDFPSPGIIFKDITPVLGCPEAFKDVMDALYTEIAPLQPDVIVGIESRGFIFGAPLALRLAASFVPIRKAGKLPGKTVRQDYDLEYGTNSIEIHTDAITPGQRVVVVDDLLATGGTAAATSELVTRLGGLVIGFAFVIELDFLNGRTALNGQRTISLIHVQ